MVCDVTQPPWGQPPAPPQSWPPARAPWPAPTQTWPPQQAQGWPPPQQGWPPPQQGWPQPQAPNRGPVQPGYFPPPQPPRKRGSFFGSLLKFVLIVGALLFAASLAAGFLFGPDAPAPTPGQQNGPVAPGTTYQNEDYTPPPVDLNPPKIPVPKNVPAAETLTKANPVYNQSIPSPTRCTMGTVNALTATAPELEAHLNDLMGCLMTVFERPVVAAGFVMPRPSVTVYSAPIKTACGDFKEVNAAYCAGDQRVYYAKPLLKAFPPAVQKTTYAAETIIAHEFAHALQARTGVLVSEKALEQRASSEAAAAELSRRTETQADCFAGQFVRSVAQSQNLGRDQLAGLSTLAYNIGDDILSGKPNDSGGHGTGKARQAWFDKGLGSDSMGVCNTFTAPAGQVR